MQHIVRAVLSSVAILVLAAGCGGDADASMPDVVGTRLDVALSDLERAGIDDEPEIVGGGLFGVVDEGNWVVCEQLPPAGDTVTDTPRLTVDRSCPDAGAEESEEPEETDETEETEAAPTEPQILTAENSREFKALLALKDNCSNEIKSFAKDHKGMTAEFDGYIANLMPSGDYETRFNYLIAPGDFDPDTISGPSFQFYDIPIGGLNVTGKGVPSNLRTGINLHFTVELGSYSSHTCLYQLEPVETTARR